MTLGDGAGRAGEGTTDRASIPAKLDPERAEALAASLRPSWEPDPPGADLLRGAQLGKDGDTVRESFPSAEMLDSNQIIEAAPRSGASMRPSAPEFTPRAASVAPPAVAAPASIPPTPTTVRMSSAPPRPADGPREGRNARARREASAVATSELAAIVPKSSNKGLVYAGAGVAVLGLIFVIARAGASDDTPKPAATTTATATARAEEIPPPPPPREEIPAAQPTATMAAEPAPAPVATTKPKPEVVTKPEVVAKPAPAPRPATAKPVKPAPAPPAPPKSAPKGTSGGIVRDTPF